MITDMLTWYGTKLLINNNYHVICYYCTVNNNGELVNKQQYSQGHKNSSKNAICPPNLKRKSEVNLFHSLHFKWIRNG